MQIVTPNQNLGPYGLERGPGDLSYAYNLQGLNRWKRMLPMAARRSNGTGEGGVDVIMPWDSLGVMAGTTVYHDSVAAKLRNKLQARFNPSGVIGGCGTRPWRTGVVAISGGAPLWSAPSRMPFAAATTATGTNGTRTIAVASTTGMAVGGTVYFTTTNTYRTIKLVDDATHFTVLDAEAVVTTTNGETVQMVSVEGGGTFTGYWPPVSGVSHAGAGINRLRCTGTSAAASVVRMLMLNSDDISKRNRCSSIDFLYGTEAVAGTLTVDVKYTSTDAAITPGTGEASFGTATQNMNAASSGGNRKTLTLTGGTVQSLLIQAAITSGTGYVEGIIGYNGDEDCGVRTHQMPRVGASSGDSWTAATLSATFTKYCARTTRATYGALAIMNLMTNDMAADRSVDDFKTNMATILDSAGVTNGMSVLYVIPFLSDAGYLTNEVTWAAYISAVYELAASRTDWMTVLNMYEYQGSPTVTTAFEAVPYFWIDTAAAKHNKDLGNEVYAEAIFRVLEAVA
jgi:hypothetical protein